MTPRNCWTNYTTGEQLIRLYRLTLINRLLAVIGIIGFILACNESDHYVMNVIGVSLTGICTIIYNIINRGERR